MITGYEKLFEEIAHSNEILAERVMELNREKGDEKSEQTASIMREDYSNLYDRIRDENFELIQLERNDWAKLLIGTMIIIQNLEDKIQGEQKAVQGYRIDIIPKLQRIIDETKTDEEAQSLVENLFKIEETNS